MRKLVIFILIFSFFFTPISDVFSATKKPVKKSVVKKKVIKKKVVPTPTPVYLTPYVSPTPTPTPTLSEAEILKQFQEKQLKDQAEKDKLYWEEEKKKQVEFEIKKKLEFEIKAKQYEDKIKQSEYEHKLSLIKSQCTEPLSIIYGLMETRKNKYYNYLDIVSKNSHLHGNIYGYNGAVEDAKNQYLSELKKFQDQIDALSFKCNQQFGSDFVNNFSFNPFN